MFFAKNKYIILLLVAFLGIAALVFPLGLDSDFARKVCGANTGRFMPGDCEIAWGYMIGIMTILLMIFCPILAKYSTNIKDYDDVEEALTDYEYNKSECVSLRTNSSSKVMTTV